MKQKFLYDKKLGLNKDGLKISEATARAIKRLLKRIKHEKFDPLDVEQAILRATATELTFAWLRSLNK